MKRITSDLLMRFAARMEEEGNEYSVADAIDEAFRELGFKHKCKFGDAILALLDDHIEGLNSQRRIANLRSLDPCEIRGVATRIVHDAEEQGIY